MRQSRSSSSGGRKCASLRISLALAVFLSAPAVAQESQPPAGPVSTAGAATLPAGTHPNPPTLSLTPAVISARGGFGQTLDQTLTISNQTPSPFPFVMVAQDVVVKDGKRVFAAAGDTPGSIAASAVFSPPSGVAKPFSTTSVNVLITVPQQTGIRALVAIFHGTVPENGSPGSVAVTASLGTLITFNLSDNVQVEAGEIQVTLPTGNANLGIAETLTNVGTEPVLPEGVVAILDHRGALVAKVPFTAQRLLPAEKLPFTAEYAGELRPGRYRALCSFQYEGKTITTEQAFAVP